MSLYIHHTTFDEILGNTQEIEKLHEKKARKLAEKVTSDSNLISKIIKIYGEGRNNTTEDSFFSPNTNVINKITVPDFQREYVWSTKNSNEIGDFLHDITEVYNFLVTKKNDSNADDYLRNLDHETGLFFGNIIFLLKGNEFEVIDGQQRFTTIFLFLAAYRTWIQYRLRDEDLIDNAKKEELTKLIDFCNACFFRADQYFFEPSLTIKTIFDKYVSKHWFDQDCADLVYQKSISQSDFEKKSKNFLPKDFRESSFNNKNEMLSEWEVLGYSVAESQLITSIFQKFIEGINKHFSSIENISLIANIFKKIKFSRVVVDDEEEAYVFFERTNSRGATLEIYDLLKAYVFGNSGKNELSTYKAKWQEIIQNKADKVSNIQLVKYFWNSMGGGAKADTVFKHIKNKYHPNFYNREESISNLVEDIHLFSEFYYICTKSRFSISEFKEFLQKLNKLHGFSTEDNKFVNRHNTSERFNKLAKSLNALTTFGHVLHIPMVFSILNVFYKFGMQKDNEVKRADQLIAFFDSLEKVHFRLKVMSTAPNFYESTYHGYAMKFHSILSKNEKFNLWKKIADYYYFSKAKQIKESNNTNNLAEHYITPSEVDFFYEKFSNSDIENFQPFNPQLIKQSITKTDEYFSKASAILFKEFATSYYHQIVLKYDSAKESFDFGQEPLRVSRAKIDNFESKYKLLSKDFEVWPHENKFIYMGQFYENKKIIKLQQDGSLKWKDFDKELDSIEHQELAPMYREYFQYLKAIYKLSNLHTGRCLNRSFDIEPGYSYDDAYNSIKKFKDRFVLIPHQTFYKFRGKRLTYYENSSKDDFCEYRSEISKIKPDPYEFFDKYLIQTLTSIKDAEKYPQGPSAYEKFIEGVIEKNSELKYREKNKNALVRYLLSGFNKKLPVYDFNEDDHKTTFTLDHIHPKKFDDIPPPWVNDIGNLFLLDGELNNDYNTVSAYVKIYDLYKYKRDFIINYEETLQTVEDLYVSESKYENYNFNSDEFLVYKDEVPVNDIWSNEKLEQIVRTRTEKIAIESYSIWEPNIDSAKDLIEKNQNKKRKFSI